MEKDLLTLILESIEKAQQRTRRAFFLNLLVSSLVLIFAFNFSISQGNAKPPRPDSTGDTEEYKIQLARYFNRYTYSIPIIGVTISADDFAFFGPLALFIFSFYYVSCSRNSDTQLRNLHKRMDATPLDREILAVALESEVVLNTSSHIPHHMKWLGH
jgi:hypothetical protein